MCGTGSALQGHMCGRGAYMAGEACVACIPPSDRYYEIRSMSGRYASYWNAFLFFMFMQFSANILSNNMLTPPLGLAPQWEILDPPLA